MKCSRWAQRRVYDLARPRLGWILAALLVCAVLANGATTIGTSSYLQVNLSYMPFSSYTSGLASLYFSQNGIASCPNPTTFTIQQCFQAILGQLYSQSVTGIRIFVTFCDSASLAFTNDGETTTCHLGYTSNSWNPSGNSYQQAWVNNAKAFFQDVANAGIPNVTITTAASGSIPGGGQFPSQPSSSASSPNGKCTGIGNCCSDTPSAVYYNGLVPFGLTSSGVAIGNYWTENPHTNAGYSCAPVNPYFLGWANYFNVINAVLGAAKAATCPQTGYPNCTPLTVYELESQQELQPVFTVLMRYIYDNSSYGVQSAPSQYVVCPNGPSNPCLVNVLAGLRAQMSANGYDPGRVQWSADWYDGQFTATENCANVYVDYARNSGLDFVTQAIIGGVVGFANAMALTDGLPCGGSLTGMPTSPISSTLPDLVDAHIYPQVAAIQGTDALITQAAETDYGDVPHFLTEAGLQSAAIVIGETYAGTLWPGEINGFYCWGTSQNNPHGFAGYPTPPNAPTDNVAGFNNEGVSSPLSSYTVTVRPWMELMMGTGQCYGYGRGPGGLLPDYQVVNYPNGSGPYVPTHQ